MARPPSKPVLWFFVLACVLSGVGQCVHLFVADRLAAGVPAGTPVRRDILARHSGPPTLAARLSAEA